MCLESNQFTLASLRTARLENRTRRHGNSSQVGHESRSRVCWRNCEKPPRFGEILGGQIVRNLK